MLSKPLPLELRQQITEFLTSLTTVQNTTLQQSFIAGAGLDDNLQNQINVGLPAGPFIQLLLSTLISYGTLADGRDALVAVLEAAKFQVGSNRQAECDRLIGALGGASSPAASTATSLSQSSSPVTKTDVLNRLYQTFRQEGMDEWTSSAQICEELGISQDQLSDFILDLKIKGFLEAKFLGQRALLKITPDGVAILK